MYRKSLCCLSECGSLIGSLLVGISVGTPACFGLLPGLVATIPVVLAFSTLVLVFLLVGLLVAAWRPTGLLAACLCAHGIRLLAGILGTLLTVLVLIALAGALFPVVLLLIGLTAAFLTYLLIQLICFVICLLRRLCTASDISTC